MNNSPEFACISKLAAERAQKKLKRENKLWKKRMKRLKKYLKPVND